GLPPEARCKSANLSAKHADDADDQSEERKSFDQCRGDDHVGADASAGFRLTSDGFHRVPADVADALAAANNGKPGAYRGTENAQAFVRDQRSGLRQSLQKHVDLLPD